MKNSTISCFLFIIISINSFAQVETKYFRPGVNTISGLHKHISHVQKSDTKRMPAFDISKLKKEDAERDSMDVPFRFGKAFNVNYTLEDGLWEEVENGRLWSITIKSENAISLNFIFKDFHLPEGAYLYIENKDKDVIYGPVTQKIISSSTESFLTDIIKGDMSTIYLYEPINKKNESTLTIKRVIHGYRGIAINENGGIVGASSSCNEDIACWPSYNEESYAVALVMLSNGYELCSGSLLMNTNYTFEPYFLTAFHCLDNDQNGILSNGEIEEAENFMFKFCFKKISCNDDWITSSYTYNKDNFCSAWYNTDFALLKLKDTVSQNQALCWLGWNNSGNTPQSATCIHHPAGDVMKISLDLNSLTSGNLNNGNNNAWCVDFDYGITQQGSSGSPLFDSSHRVVGQLHGGQHNTDICSWTDRVFGKLSNSWNGGGHNYDRLSNWLDPINTGQTTIDSYHPFAIVGNGHLFTQEVYQINNLPSGWTVSWSFSSLYTFPSGLVQANTPSTNQCTLYNPNKAHVVGTLTATIYKSGGELYGSASKNISTVFGFIGTYWQEDNFNVIPNNIPETSFSDGDTLMVGPKCDVYIKSYFLPGTTITHAGANLNYWNYSLDGSYGIIHLRFPYKRTNQHLTITAVDNTNQSIYELYLDAIANPLLNFNPSLLASSDQQRLYLTMDVDDENYSSAKCTQTTEAIRWDVVVCDAITSKVIYKNNVEGWTKVIDTTGWAAGIYIIKAQIGEHFVTQKIIIR